MFHRAPERPEPHLARPCIPGSEALAARIFRPIFPPLSLGAGGWAEFSDVPRSNLHFNPSNFISSLICSHSVRIGPSTDMR